MAFFGIGKSNDEDSQSKNKSSVLDIGKSLLKDVQDMDILKKQKPNQNPDAGENSNSILDRGKDALLEASLLPVRAAIKGSGTVIRKVYEARINVVNEFSDIKPDWAFLDHDTIRKDIKKLEKEVKKAIRELKGKNGSLKTVNRLLDELLIATSLLNDNLQKCDEIIETYNLSTPFSLYGIKCLKAEKDGNADKSTEYAMQYYDMNNQKVSHPRIAVLVAKKLSETGRYEQAIEVIENSVRKYPENIETHKLLYQLHINTGNTHGSKVEIEILSLLNGCQ